MTTPHDTRPTVGHVLHRLHVAGAEVLAADLARKLQREFRFVFLNLDGIGPLGEQLAAEGFTVLHLERRPGLDWAVARRLHDAIAAHDIRLVHAHQYTPFFYASASRFLASHPPLIFTEHGRHYPDLRSRKRVFANRFLLKAHDRVTAVGGFIRQALIDKEGIPADRIEVIYNGIDADRFTRGSDADYQVERHAARASLGLNDTQPVVLQVARFHPVKDHGTAIRAMGHVAAALPDAVLLLAGDGEGRSAAEDLVRTLGLERNVQFLGVRRDVPRLMAAADAFVLSSLSEGISVTLLEAMGCRLAIAATNVGGNGEVVDHMKTGLLSPRGDAGALGGHLLALLKDPQLRHHFGEAGRQRLLEKFTEQQMHDRYAQLYREMIR